MDIEDDLLSEPLELEPVEENENDPDPETDILYFTESKFLLFNFKNSKIPVIILDSNIQIIWENLSFSTLFGKGHSRFGYHLKKVFNPYLDDDKIINIIREIKSKRHGFSWKGRVEARDKHSLPILANLLLTPIFKEADDVSKIPSGYIGIFDDITRENRDLTQRTFLSLLEASKLKDNDTGKHISRVAAYAKLMAQKLYQKSDYSEIDKEFIEDISFLAAMHDVGKIGTPDDIINKGGSLEDWEWEIMKEHTINGAYILSTYPSLMAKEIALSHHEKWDGSGYPYSFAGNMIPLSARITAIADVYDALRMKRSYKEPFTHKETCIEIEKSKESHFDPQLIEILRPVFDEFDKIYETLKDVI